MPDSQRFGRCPWCAEDQLLTPKRQMIKSHLYEGSKCRGSGLTPGEKAMTASGDLADTQGRQEPHGGDVSPQDETATRVEGSGLSRSSRVGLALLALALIPITVMCGVYWVYSTATPPARYSASSISASSISATPTATVMATTSSKSNWPINQDGEDLSATQPSQAEPPPTPSIPDTATATVEGEDPELADALAAAGIDEGTIRILGAVGTETGYLFQSRTPTYEEMQSFAFMSLLECQEVASGAKTWVDSAAEAVASGAGMNDAQRMVSHLENNFCP